MHARAHITNKASISDTFASSCLPSDYTQTFQDFPQVVQKKEKRHKLMPKLNKTVDVFLKYINVSGKGTERTESDPLFYMFWTSP